MREVFGETFEESLSTRLPFSRMLLPRPEAILNEETKESDRAFFGEKPLSVIDELRFLEMVLSSGMNRLSSRR